MLGKVLLLFNSAVATLKMKNCSFFFDSIDHIGHIVGFTRPELVASTTDAEREGRPPTSITEFRSFLGLCNVFQRLVPGFERIVAELT